MTKNSNRVFIRNLPHEITEKQLLNEFQRFGTIIDHSVILKADRGIAFISFKDKESYDNCLSQNDKLKINGRTIGIYIAQPTQYEGSYYENYNSSDSINSRQYLNDYDTIFVGNIPNNVEDFEVREIFMKYKPYEVKMGYSDDYKIQYALIKILDQKLLDEAIQKMNGYILKDKKIAVSIAEQSIH